MNSAAVQMRRSTSLTSWPRAVAALNDGGLAIVPTDTLYGIVARAFDKKAVRQLYRIRRHTPQKPFIILISDIEDLALFGVKPNAAALRFLAMVWPGKVSVILSCRSKKLSYLHRGTDTLAFRLPRSKRLRSLLRATGPLVAPSANPEGKKPAETITQARKCFGQQVDAYINGGRLVGKPSTLISLCDGGPRVLRLGAARI